MNVWGYAILVVILAINLLELALSLLNRQHTRRICQQPPETVLEFYDEDRLKLAAAYQTARSRLGLSHFLVRTPLFFALFLTGALTTWAGVIKGLFAHEFLRAALFFGSYFLLFYLAGLPFRLISTFGIERRFGFNRTTWKLYLRDTMIAGLLSVLFSGGILWLVITLIHSTGGWWWVWVALSLSALSLVMTYIYPTFIAPLFNKFEELEPGELRDRIEELAQQARFPVMNIYRMDASRRSEHSNAYFTGLGRKKRIVLFDTLLRKHDNEEIVSILAHEIAHYRLGHIRKMLLFQVCGTFVAAFVAGLMLNEPFIYSAFNFEKETYVGLFLIAVIFSPLGFILSPLGAALARYHEYQADRFAVRMIEERETMVQTLARLYRDNLANPVPHPLVSFFYYTHPTLLERIRAIRSMSRQVVKSTGDPLL
jgi:STE24 endopeptidase